GRRAAGPDRVEDGAADPAAPGRRGARGAAVGPGDVAAVAARGEERPGPEERPELRRVHPVLQGRPSSTIAARPAATTGAGGRGTRLPGRHVAEHGPRALRSAPRSREQTTLRPRGGTVDA